MYELWNRVELVFGKIYRVCANPQDRDCFKHEFAMHGCRTHDRFPGSGPSEVVKLGNSDDSSHLQTVIPDP